MTTQQIELIRGDGSKLQVRVLIADDQFERAAGFQYICPHSIDNTLILFSYPHAIDARFHMNHVYAPLDIGFFGTNGYLLEQIVMQPYIGLNRPLYGPKQSFQYALEARAGFFAAHNLTGKKLYLNINSL